MLLGPSKVENHKWIIPVKLLHSDFINLKPHQEKEFLRNDLESVLTETKNSTEGIAFWTPHWVLWSKWLIMDSLRTSKKNAAIDEFLQPIESFRGWHWLANLQGTIYYEWRWFPPPETKTVIIYLTKKQFKFYKQLKTIQKFVKTFVDILKC